MRLDEEREQACYLKLARAAWTRGFPLDPEYSLGCYGQHIA